MSKRILAIICTLVLMLTLVPLSLAASGDLIWKMTSAEIDAFIATGSDEKGTDWLTNAGKPTYTNVDGALTLTKRTADWNALDVKTDLLDSNTEYVIVVEVTSAAAAKLKLAHGDGSYSTLVSIEGDTATLKAKFKPADLPGRHHIRIQTEGASPDLTVKSIAIWEGEEGDIATATVVGSETEEPSEEPAEEEPSEEPAEEEPSEEPSEEPTVEEPVVEEPVVVAEPAELITLSESGSFGGAFVNTTLLEVGKSYKIVYNITTLSGNNGGFRVRYCTDMGDTGSFVHNDGNNSAHSSDAAQVVNFAAKQVPAQMANDSVAVDNTFDLTVNFTLGANITDLDPLYMDYIGLFGSQGNGSYTVNAVTVYDAAGAVVGNAGAPLAVTVAPPAAVTQPPAEVKPAPTEKPIDNNKTGVESFLFLALGLLAVTAAGAVFFVKKSQSK